MLLYEKNIILLCNRFFNEKLMVLEYAVILDILGIFVLPFQDDIWALEDLHQILTF